MITFGPVPSRRLGRSLGINSIPPKTCSYSCAYCQVGRTSLHRATRQTFFEPEEIATEVRARVEQAREAGDVIDYLTFVPDGEPTLDSNLGRTIKLVKQFGIRIAVISNGSLLWRDDVRDELHDADLVSIKLDTVNERIWRRMDRPHGSLFLADVMDGILRFARTFGGELITETMLVQGCNDKEEDVAQVADFLARVAPATAYLAIPTRPPAEPWVHPPDEEVVNRAFQLFNERINHVEYLIGYEGDAFSRTGDPVQDLLSITAVHPMRIDALETFLHNAGLEWGLVSRLLAEGRLVETDYLGRTFYVRRFGPQPASDKPTGHEHR
jgi:wyosine [tRNA(Phe)-imidazoG37] synthetase (radical SAM superfamily)